MKIMIKNYITFIKENLITTSIQDVAWLYFLCYLYPKGMTEKSWGKDKRMGVIFRDSMKNFSCVKFEDETYYATDECKKIVDQYFGAKTYEKSVDMKKELQQYDTEGYQGYKISRIPEDLFFKKNPKLEEDFDRIKDKITKHFNSQIGSDKILGSLAKSKSLKKWNYKTCLDMFDGEIPEKILIYRGIKNKYNPTYDDGIYTCWSISKSEGERFAKYHFTGGYQGPILSKYPTLLVAETTIDDIQVFIGGSEGEVIMKNPVEIKEIIPMYENLNEAKSNIKSFDYVAVKNNYKGEPILYVVDFKVVRDTGEEVECKIKGYEWEEIESKSGKYGFVKVNDFGSDRTHKLGKKDFKTGTSKRKIYDILL